MSRGKLSTPISLLLSAGLSAATQLADAAIVASACSIWSGWKFRRIAVPLILLLSPVAEAGTVAGGADTIVVDALIYTADRDRREVQALAIRDGEIIYLGDRQGAMNYRGESTAVVDAGGRRILPGLHDAHIHPTAIIEYPDCNLRAAAVTLLELASFVRACIERLQVPAGNWLSVKQWNFTEGNTPGEGLDNLRQALDAASTRHPIFLLGNDGHHHATNSAGLARARNRQGQTLGLNSRTLRSEFAELVPYVGVDASGEPNGAVNEHVYEVLGAPGVIGADLQQKREHIGQLPTLLHSRGITSFQDAAVTPDLLPLYEHLLADPVALHVSLAQWYPPHHFQGDDGEVDYDAIMAQAAQMRDRLASQPNAKADTLKFFVDGVLEGDPLAMPPTLPNSAQFNDFHQPRFEVAPDGEVTLAGYVDLDSAACQQAREAAESDSAAVSAFVDRHGFHPVQCRRSRGEMTAPRSVVLDFARTATTHGFAVHFHAIGDRAVRTAVDAIEAGRRVNPNIGHSVTHVQLISDDDIARLAAMRVPVAFTYAWASRVRAYDMTVIPFIEHLAGEEALYDPDSYYYQHFYPARSLRDAGGVLAAGSDAPVESEDPRPFFNMAVAVTRDTGEGVFNPAERIDIRDAIDAYTINGARLIGLQQRTGSLEVGKAADFILLDRDVIALAEAGRTDEIAATRVLETWFAGRRVYRAGDN